MIRGRGGGCPTIPLADTWSTRQSGCRGLLGGPGGGAHRALQVLSGLRSLRRDGRLSPRLRLGWGSDAGLPGASWPVATGCLESGRHSSLSPATLPTVPRPPGAHVSLRSCFTRGSSSVWPRPHPRCRVRAAPDGPSKAYSNSPELISCKKKKKMCFLKEEFYQLINPSRIYWKVFLWRQCKQGPESHGVKRLPFMDSMGKGRDSGPVYTQHHVAHWR